MNLSKEHITALAAERDLSTSELMSLLQAEGLDSLLFSAADKVRRQIYGDAVYVRGLIEASQIVARITAITVGFAGTIRVRPDIAWSKTTSLPAAPKDMNSAFAPLYYKEGRTLITQMRKSVGSSPPFGTGFRTARSHSPLGKGQRTATRPTLMRERIAICCGTRLPTRRITVNFTRRL